MRVRTLSYTHEYDRAEGRVNFRGSGRVHFEKCLARRFTEPGAVREGYVCKRFPIADIPA
jgi:hypothetical protein